MCMIQAGVRPPVTPILFALLFLAVAALTTAASRRRRRRSPQRCLSLLSTRRPLSSWPHRMASRHRPHSSLPPLPPPSPRRPYQRRPRHRPHRHRPHRHRPAADLAPLDEDRGVVVQRDLPHHLWRALRRSARPLHPDVDRRLPRHLVRDTSETPPAPPSPAHAPCYVPHSRRRCAARAPLRAAHCSLLEMPWTRPARLFPNLFDDNQTFAGRQ